MNPYASKAEDIPPDDKYGDMPFYGRYFPGPLDFRVDPRHIGSLSEESLKYWSSVIEKCDESNQIYPADDDGRDVFALGSVIIKSGHLHEHPEIDFSNADANEVAAVEIARGVLENVSVPQIYFSGNIQGRQVLVQERIPGVGLNVAWPYLSENQRVSFKVEARKILHKLHAIRPQQHRKGHGHVVQDPNIATNGRIHSLEAKILFSSFHGDDLGFMHNDLTESNIIVDNGRIVGVVDWEMAGFFGWDKAAEVHRRIRTPQKEHFAQVKLSEEKLSEIMWWNDLYDFVIPEDL